jgi:hypothetical protein
MLFSNFQLFYSVFFFLHIFFWGGEEVVKINCNRNCQDPFSQHEHLNFFSTKEKSDQIKNLLKQSVGAKKRGEEA